MMDSLASRGVDELDLALLHLLQIAPRASWAAAGRVLLTAPSTLAARLERLEARGLAWWSVYPNPARSGWLTVFVDLSTAGAQGSREAVIRALCADPRVVAVSETDQLSRLSLTVFCTDADAFTAFLLDDLPRIAPGVDARARPMLAVHAEGASWRLDALTREQRTAAEALVPRRRARARMHSVEEERDLVDALIQEPRASVSAIARTIGEHPATVARRLEHLLAEGIVTMRCEVSPQRTGWPVERTWLLDTAGLPGATVAARLRGVRELRLTASLGSDVHFAITGFSRTLDDAMDLERRILAALPEVTVVDRIHHLRTRKRMGRVLDTEGRPIR